MDCGDDCGGATGRWVGGGAADVERVPRLPIIQKKIAIRAIAGLIQRSKSISIPKLDPSRRDQMSSLRRAARIRVKASSANIATPIRSAMAP